VLWEAARNLYNLIAAGALDQREVEHGLLEAAGRCGLLADEPRQTRRTLASARQVGLEHPRRLPERTRPDASYSPAAREVGERIPATKEGYRLLRAWADGWPQRLVADGEQVVDVPAKLAARVRVLSSGHGRKTDPGDAVSVAVADRSAPRLREVGVEDHAVVLHLLTNRREDLVRTRTQTLNRLHRLLCDLVAGGAGRNLTANRATALLGQVMPTSAPAIVRHQLATDLVADIRHLDQRIAWSGHSPPAVTRR
jgi:Transposase